MMFLVYFTSRGTGQLIARRGIMKSEDYMKILVKSLQLSGQNLDLGRRSNFQQDYDLKHMSKSLTV